MKSGKGISHTLNTNFIDITSKTDLILVVQVQTITSHEPQTTQNAPE